VLSVKSTSNLVQMHNEIQCSVYDVFIDYDER